MSIKFLDSNGSGNLGNAIKGIDYAIKMGAKILSISWGGYPYSKALEEVTQRSKQAGVLFIAAVGNNASDNDIYPEYPSGYNTENIISVAAIDNHGSLADFSNYGLKTVDLAAPGVNIVSINGGRYDSFSGTSMAAPFVTGAAALIWSNEPLLTAAEVKARLLNTARPLSSLTGKVATGGMLDVYSAMTVKK
jgi:subtilisin family serine protease